MSPRLELRKKGTVVAGDIQDLERAMPPNCASVMAANWAK
jgi:hypothetical protein